MTGAHRLGLLLTAATWSVSAVASDGPVRSVRLGSAEVMRLAEEAYRRGNAAVAETAFRALLQDPTPEVRAEARFRLAKLVAAAGRENEAAVLLRRILDDYPGAAPARLELATLFNKMGRRDSVLRELRALRTAELPPNLARFVDRMTASLQAGKPLGLHVELALAPDSNINRATRSDTLGTIFGDFTFEEDSKAKSGVGAAIRGAAHARFSLGRDLSVVGRAVTSANLYRDKDFNDAAAELSLGPEIRLGGMDLSLELGVGQQWYGMRPWQRGMRLAGSLARPVDSVSALRLDGAIRWTDNRFNDLQDGRGVSLRARYERALSRQLSLAASLSVDRYKARDAAYSTRSWTAGLTAYRDFGRTSLNVGTEVGRLEADEALSILPEARRDKLLRFSISAVMRQFTIAGFAPVARVIFERNKSNVEFYDFKRTRTEFGISRAF